MNDQEFSKTQFYKKSSPPHIFDASSVSRMYGNWILALTPIWLASFFAFGFQAVLQIVISLAGAVTGEYLGMWFLQKTPSSFQVSCLYYGVLLGVLFPFETAGWAIFLISLFSIFVFQHLAGDKGKRFYSPALAGALVLCSFSFHGSHVLTSDLSADPLRSLIFIQSGISISEVSLLAILLSYILLVIRKVVDGTAPWIYFCAYGGVGILVGADFQKTPLSFLLFTACFLVSDYALAPSSKQARWIYAALCGMGAGFLGVSDVIWGGPLYAVGLAAGVRFWLEEGIRPSGSWKAEKA